MGIIKYYRLRIELRLIIWILEYVVIPVKIIGRYLKKIYLKLKTRNV